MLADEVIEWEGLELPVWLFQTFDEFDYFMDTLLAVENADTAGAWFQAVAVAARGERYSGVLFRNDCGGVQAIGMSPLSRRAALAIIRIDEDLPQEVHHE